MFRYLSLSGLLLLSGLGVIAPATAAPASDANVPSVSWDADGTLAIGGVSILNLRDKSVCQSMRHRADTITGRLVEALHQIHREGRFKEINVTIEPSGEGPAPIILGERATAKEPWILVEGVPVMRVTYEDVQATRQKPDALARFYATSFEKALVRVYQP